MICTHFHVVLGPRSTTRCQVSSSTTHRQKVAACHASILPHCDPPCLAALHPSLSVHPRPPRMCLCRPLCNCRHWCPRHCRSHALTPEPYHTSPIGAPVMSLSRLCSVANGALVMPLPVPLVSPSVGAPSMPLSLTLSCPYWCPCVQLVQCSYYAPFMTVVWSRSHCKCPYYTSMTLNLS